MSNLTVIQCYANPSVKNMQANLIRSFKIRELQKSTFTRNWIITCSTGSEDRTTGNQDRQFEFNRYSSSLRESPPILFKLGSSTSFSSSS